MTGSSNWYARAAARAAATVAALLLAAAGLQAQGTPAPAPPGSAPAPGTPAAATSVATAVAQIPPLDVGAVAPDFELPGATRYGVLDRPVRLSDYKGEVVVLAFFFKARTKG